MIDQLPLLTSDPERVRRLTARCHERLARQRRRTEDAAAPVSPAMLMAERAIVGGLCAIYLSSVVFDVLRGLYL